MNTGELLTELRENILHDRSNRVAGADDKLWSDVTLMRYMNEAQRRFARKSLIIRDSSSVATVVTLVTGQKIYPLNPAVLAVISAQYQDDVVDLARAGHAALSMYRQTDSYYFDPDQFRNIPPGKPLAVSTDESVAMDDGDSMSVINLRVYPAPDAAYNGKKINLRVVRLPLERLSLRTLKVNPEVPEDHHLEMLDWAAYLALRIVDVDGGMPERADEFRKAFEAHVLEARNSVLRKLFAPTQWGFGRNGFNWSS